MAKTVRGLLWGVLIFGAAFLLIDFVADGLESYQTTSTAADVAVHGTP
jgi:hypothetical protein